MTWAKGLAGRFTTKTRRPDGRGEARATVEAAVDGVMMRRPIGYALFHQGWQPNRSVLLENVGETDVVNPWLVVNGKCRWRTLADVFR